MNGQQFKKLLYGILPVVLFGFVTGYILWYKIFEYPPHRYSLDFNGSMWISTGKQTPYGYFVKEIFIPEEVGDAWITIAATDNVTLFINGIKAASDTFISMNVSAIHDVTGKIHNGKNVIAVSVNRGSYPGGPKLLIKGVYTDLSGKEHILVSDNTWTVSSVEEKQGQGTIPWYSKQFDHSGWVKATVEGRPSTFPIYTSPLPPYMLGKSLSGYWIWHPESGIRSAYFTKSFMVDSLVKDGIIGIAGSSVYDLTVNGVHVANRNIFNKNLDIYSITSLLHSGENTIGIGVKSQDTAPGLFIEGYVYDGNSVVNLKSDETWKTITNIPQENYILDMNSSEWKAPVLLVKYPSQPWGVLSKNVRDVDLPLTYTAKTLFKFSLFILTVIVVILCFWIVTAFLYARIKNDNLWDGLLLDGILHIPPLLFMFFIYLFKFDVRYDPSFPFQSKFVLISLGILFLLRIARFVGIHIKNWRPKFLETENKQITNLLFLFLMACLITTGFLIRLNELDYASLSHDEISMMQYTDGLLKTGSPAKVLGSYTKPLTTYELLPYSVSIPVIIFGFNDFAARLHSVFWGTLEILLLYILGKTLFSRIAGFIAAAIYTFHPWCIIWSQNITYPQLTQVLATLTALFFYKAIDYSTPMNKKFLYLTAVTFSLMYLSWEGSGFFLVGMLLAILVHKGTDLSWLKNKHLWAGFAIILLTVFIQQSRRILYQDVYLVIGSSVSDISLPQLFFLDPMYYPYYYIRKFFFTENNYILSLFSIAGIFLIFKSRPLRYLYVILVNVVFCMTNFIPISANRYVYYVEPFLILIASAVGFIYIDVLRGLFKEKTIIIRLSTSLAAVAMVLILFMASNTILLKLYLLSEEPFEPPTLTRQNVYWNDYKSTSKYIAENIRKGDVIFSMTPHTLNYYTGIKGDYSLSTLLGKTMFFDISEKYPGFLDKFMGNPVILSLNEFKLIVEKYKRAWFISAPHVALTANDEETIEYIMKNFKVVYESYNAKIYLWEK